MSGFNFSVQMVVNICWEVDRDSERTSREKYLVPGAQAENNSINTIHNHMDIDSVWKIHSVMRDYFEMHMQV